MTGTPRLPASASISVVAYGELVYIARKSPDPRKAMLVLEELIALIPVLPMTTEAATV